MDFYQILLEIMEEKSFSIPDVARATGLSDSTIRSIISRKTKLVMINNLILSFQPSFIFYFLFY